MPIISIFNKKIVTIVFDVIDDLIQGQIYTNMQITPSMLKRGSFMYIQLIENWTRYMRLHGYTVQFLSTYDKLSNDV